MKFLTLFLFGNMEGKEVKNKKKKRKKKKKESSFTEVVLICYG